MKVHNSTVADEVRHVDNADPGDTPADEEPGHPIEVEAGVPTANGQEGPEPTRARRQVAISVRSLLTAAVIVALMASVGVMGWLYNGAERQRDAVVRQASNDARAEKLALNYAVNAAAIKAEDLNPWKAALVAGTSPELKGKLTKAADQMEQILVPLQWNSTAQPLAAKVRSNTGGVYVVDCFVSVLTKTVQGPEPMQSTAAYNFTIDSGKDWQITDVGGVGNAQHGR